MTDLDLDRLGDVWRQRPDPAELERLKRSAEMVRRRARWGQWVDIVSAAVVAGVVLFLVLSNPRTDTLLVGGSAILVLVIGQYRRRRLREAELRGLTGSVEDMLDQSIGRVTATLKLTRFSLVTFAPALFVGLMVAYLLDYRSSGEFLPGISADPSVKVAVQIIAGASLLGMAAYLLVAIRKSRRELDRLTSLREAYRQEVESTATE